MSPITVRGGSGVGARLTIASSELPTPRGLSSDFRSSPLQFSLTLLVVDRTQRSWPPLAEPLGSRRGDVPQ